MWTLETISWCSTSSSRRATAMVVSELLHNCTALWSGNSLTISIHLMALWWYEYELNVCPSRPHFLIVKSTPPAMKSTKSQIRIFSTTIPKRTQHSNKFLALTENWTFNYDLKYLQHNLTRAVGMLSHEYCQICILGNMDGVAQLKMKEFAC